LFSDSHFRAIDFDIGKDDDDDDDRLKPVGIECHQTKPCVLSLLRAYPGALHIGVHCIYSN
jgi:hypothetical protein